MSFKARLGRWWGHPPRSRGSAVGDLIFWGVIALATGTQYARGLIFHDMPGWWYWWQPIIFAIDFAMFKRALDGYHYWFTNDRPSVDQQ